MKLNYLWNIGNNYEEGSKDLENLTISDVLKNICSEMEKIKLELCSKLRAAKLWCQYLPYVEIWNIS